MKNQTLLIVGGLFFVAVVGGVLLFSNNTPRQAAPATTRPTVTKPDEGPSPTLPEEEEAEKKFGEAAFTATLDDQVGGERSGEVTVAVDPFTGDTVYKIKVASLTPPESPAFYQVWVQTPQGVMGSLGKIEVKNDGTGSLETPGSKPEAGWSAVVTYQENENPVPGKRILMGSLK